MKADVIRPNFTLILTLLLLLSGVMMGIGVMSGWWSLLPLGALGVLAATYFYASTLWLVRHRFAATTIADAVWQMGNLAPDDTFVWVDAGYRHAVIGVSGRLQNGRIRVLDLYNPQLLPSLELVRVRRWVHAHLLPEAAPRASWVEGRFDLFPMRDDSVPFVVVDRVLTEIESEGDRQVLLKEIARVLQPAGRLIIVEPQRTPANQWVLGIPDVLWVQTLAKAGYVVKENRPINPLLHIYTAQKPGHSAPQQLRFDF